MHRQPSEETARGKGELSHLTESPGILQQYLQVAPWVEGSLLVGRWGCGAAFLWEESKAS